MLYGQWKKWTITALASLSTLAVALLSSVYAGGQDPIVHEFNIEGEVFTLGVSLFVLGFALGPLLWAPLSELFGRQILFAITYEALTAFQCGSGRKQEYSDVDHPAIFRWSHWHEPADRGRGCYCRPV